MGQFLDLFVVLIALLKNNRPLRTHLTPDSGHSMRSFLSDRRSTTSCQISISRDTIHIAYGYYRSNTPQRHSMDLDRNVIST